MTNGERKVEHLQIAISRNVAFQRLSAGFEAYRFVHQALPDLDPAQIDLSVELFGKRLSAPLVISPMIGGIPETQEMLDFCGKHNITADVEVIPIQKVNEAYERLVKSDVKYRFSIDMASLKS